MRSYIDPVIAALLAWAGVALLQGCAQVARQQAANDLTACFRAAKATPEAQLLFTRLWAEDPALDNAEKLSDPKPLNKEERDALVRYHSKVQPCRQIIVAHDTRYAAWELPYWQQYFQRIDAIYIKLASGELPAGVANKLTIESTGKFQADVSQGHAEAVRIEEIQRQQAAQAMLQASAAMMASQPRPTTTTTNCNWLGNQLNCTSMRQ